MDPINTYIIPNLSNYLRNLIIYNFQRPETWFATADLEIEYLYITEFKNHFILLSESNLESLKKLSNELTQRIMVFYFNKYPLNTIIEKTNETISNQLKNFIIK